MARSWLLLEFSFTHPEDVQKYGSDPYLYDERELVALPALKLAEIEQQIGMTVKDMVNGLRDSVTLADRAAVWWAMSLVRDVPPLAEFDVRTMMIEWAAAADDQGKDEAEPEPLPTSEPVAVITLPSLPVAE